MSFTKYQGEQGQQIAYTTSGLERLQEFPENTINNILSSKDDYKAPEYAIGPCLLGGHYSYVYEIGTGVVEKLVPKSPRSFVGSNDYAHAETINQLERAVFARTALQAAGIEMFYVPEHFAAVEPPSSRQMSVASLVIEKAGNGVTVEKIKFAIDHKYFHPLKLLETFLNLKPEEKHSIYNYSQSNEWAEVKEVLEPLDDGFNDHFTERNVIVVKEGQRIRFALIDFAELRRK